MTKKAISDAVIKRLPKYYRQLKALSQAGQSKVSSHALAQMLGITASQVRQDFCNFGGFGQQGYGYDVENLTNQLGVILGLDRQYGVIIIGAGNIGRALAGYSGFEKYGFTVKAMFDVRQMSAINGIPVYPTEDLQRYLQRNPTDMAVIATPKESAQSVADELVECGIKSIWNFAPMDLNVPQNVAIENIAMSESLLVLSYRTKNINQ